MDLEGHSSGPAPEGDHWDVTSLSLMVLEGKGRKGREAACGVRSPGVQLGHHF